MKTEEELKNKIAKDQLKSAIRLMEIAKERGYQEAKEKFTKKLEQLKERYIISLTLKGWTDNEKRIVNKFIEHLEALKNEKKK